MAEYCPEGSLGTTKTSMTSHKIYPPPLTLKNITLQVPQFLFNFHIFQIVGDLHKKGSKRNIENISDIMLLQIVTSQIFMVNTIPKGRLTSYWEIINATVYCHTGYI